MRRTIMTIAASLVLIGGGQLWAAPKISVSRAEYNAGVVVEGEKDYIEHQFIVKNTGDEPLKINEVRAG